jgi:hypothetical protein
MTPWLSRSQLLLRVPVLLGPMVALLATGPAGNWPPWWVVAGVLALAAAFAARPDSQSGAAAFLAVLVWWVISLGDDLQPEILLAAAALVVAHVAAVLASYGPSAMPLDPAAVRLWARRGLLVLLTVPAAWVAARLLEGEPEQPGIWVLGVVAVLTATVAATVTLTTARPGGTR